jgi:GNAT superfamily N-acetyltransferase
MTVLAPLQFEHDDSLPGAYQVHAYHGGRHVGTLVWHARRSVTVARLPQDPGAIDVVIVDPVHRRRRVATAMLEEGMTFPVPPRHSRSRTPDGDAWAGISGPANDDPLEDLTRTWDDFKRPDRPYQGWLF